MTTDYEEDLPPKQITENGKIWEREKFDRNSYQWVRPMEEDEYDWDPEKDDISLVGTDVPLRAVLAQYSSGEWQVQGAETAGPSYHRPGFTEVISSEYSESYDTADEAFRAVQEFIKKLSR